MNTTEASFTKKASDKVAETVTGKITDPILQVKNLSTAFAGGPNQSAKFKVIEDVSFDLKKGEVLGIVGESGCGKSVTSLSIMRLLPQPMGSIEAGQILFHGKDLTKLSVNEMYKIRGAKISMIFQEPMTALNPVHTVGKQMAEVFHLHQPQMKAAQIKQACIQILTEVGIPTPEKRLSEYPHQLSGGIRQRVMIAMALLCKPDILIADEPSTALDVTIQAQILELIKKIQKEMGMSVIFITHDLGVIAEMCDRVVVMYAGKVVEIASVRDLFKNPKHPYTKGLLTSIPRLDHKPKVKLNTIEGMVPDIYSYPKGCRFENRCPYKDEKCVTHQPPVETVDNNLEGTSLQGTSGGTSHEGKNNEGNSHQVSCFKWRNL